MPNLVGVVTHHGAVENENHCDFRKLRSLLIRTHMLDLISSTEDLHYENYRQAQMETRKFGEQKPRKFENPKFKEEEEALRKRFTEQVKAEEARFRQWEQHVRICLCCDRVCARTDVSTSSLQSATGSTRTSRWPTARSRRSRPSSTTFRSVTAVVPAGGERPSSSLARRPSLFLLAKMFPASHFYDTPRSTRLDSRPLVIQYLCLLCFLLAASLLPLPPLPST